MVNKVPTTYGRQVDLAKKILGLHPYDEPLNFLLNDIYAYQGFIQRYGVTPQKTIEDYKQASQEANEDRFSARVFEDLYGEQISKEEMDKMTQSAEATTILQYEDLTAKVVKTRAGVDVFKDGERKEFIGKEKSVIVSKFLNEGWQIVGDEKEEVNEVNEGVPLDVQAEIDEYVKIHAQKSKIEAELKKKKAFLKKYMTGEEYDTLDSTDGDQLYFQPSSANNTTSAYTDYLLKDIKDILPGPLLRQVTEIRVNATKLDGLLKVSREVTPEMREQVKDAKIKLEGTPHFKVRKA